MPTPQQLRAIQRYSVDIWEKGDLDAIDEVFTPDFVRHGPGIEGGPVLGRKGQKDLVTLYRTALPDLRVPIEVQCGEGDVVLARWTARGTNLGPMMGIEPTGKACSVVGFWELRFEGDQIAEEWATWDTHGFLQQIGVSLP